jgi:hypothetical protein
MTAPPSPVKAIAASVDVPAGGVVMGVRTLRLIGLAGALAGLSCGGADNASEFIDGYCSLLAPCCKMAGLPGGDGAQCRMLLGALTPASSYDKAAGEACLAELSAASAKPGFCQTGASGSDACGRVFESNSNRGSKKPGEDCMQDADCAPSSEGKVDCRSRFVMGAELSKCQVQIRGKEGDNPCVGTVDGNVTSYLTTGSNPDILPRGYLCHVADGLRCDTATAACVKIKVAGEMCSGGFSECAKTTFCDSAIRMCVDRRPVGGACATSSQCAEGGTCDTTMRVCVAQLGDGAACTSSGQCRSGRCVNNACAAGTGTNLTLAFVCGSS